MNTPATQPPAKSIVRILREVSMKRGNLLRDVKAWLKFNPDFTSAELYEVLKPNWSHVNQQWLRRNIVSYKAAVLKKVKA